MAKIVLGKRPEKFTRAVKFTLLDGGTAWINIDYVYRTRSEYGAFIDASVERSRKAAEDAIQQALKAAEHASAASDVAGSADTSDAVPLTKMPGMQEVLAKSSADNVEFILAAAESWNLDVPFSRQAVEQLVDEYPQAAMAIVETYRLACTEGRQGN